MSKIQNELDITKQVNKYFLCLTVCIFIISLVFLLCLRKTLKDNLHKENLFFVENVSAFLESRLDNIELTLNHLARLPINTDRGEGDIDDNILLRNYLSELVSVMPDVAAVAEIDMKGNYIRIPYDSAINESIKKATYSKRHLFKQVDDGTDNVLYSAPHKDYIANKRFLTLSQTILSRDATHTGAVAFDIDLNTLHGILNAFRSGVIGNVMIVEKNGTMVSDLSSDMDKGEIVEIKNMINTHQGMFYLKKENAYYYFEQLRHSQWIVVFKVESQNLNNQTYDKYFIIFAFGLLLILVAFCWGMNGKLNALRMKMTIDEPS